jgi:hypothetical protein
MARRSSSHHQGNVTAVVSAVPVGNYAHILEIECRRRHEMQSAPILSIRFRIAVLLGMLLTLSLPSTFLVMLVTSSDINASQLQSPVSSSATAIISKTNYFDSATSRCRDGISLLSPPNDTIGTTTLQIHDTPERQSCGAKDCREDCQRNKHLSSSPSWKYNISIEDDSFSSSTTEGVSATRSSLNGLFAVTRFS